MFTQAIVLLSGGLDSTYNLYRSRQEWPGAVEALSFNYGQRAWSSEARTAQTLCESLQIPWQSLDVSAIFADGTSSLTSDQQEVPTDSVDIDSLEASQKSAEKVWVANRNGVLLNVAACVAEKKKARFIVPGFNAEEAVTFPDNSVDYIEKMNACLQLSTSNGVTIRCFSQAMNKSEIAQGLVDLGGNLDRVWPCYFAGETLCGRCESCQRFLRARQSVMNP